MPIPSSQMNSGATSTWRGPSAGTTPKMTRAPTMLTSGPPTSPNRAKRGGTSPDRYISHPRIRPFPMPANTPRPDPERPRIDGKDALPDGGVDPAGRVLAQGRDGEHADDADGDERALHEARGHVRDGARFVHP